MPAPKILIDATAFLALLPIEGRLIGCDLGTKTLGIAVSDIGRRIASPLVTLELKKFTIDATAFAKIVAEQQPVGLVIGLPLHMDGSTSPRAQAARQFAENLQSFNKVFAALPMLLLDERFSTVAVERTLLAADVSRRRRAELVDKLAASYILQGALDRFNKLLDDEADAGDL